MIFKHRRQNVPLKWIQKYDWWFQVLIINHVIYNVCTEYKNQADNKVKEKMHIDNIGQILIHSSPAFQAMRVGITKGIPCLTDWNLNPAWILDINNDEIESKCCETVVIDILLVLSLD